MSSGVKNLFELLKLTASDSTFKHMNEHYESGELQYSELKAVTVPAERAASMIDEYPILAVAAARAGRPVFLAPERIPVSGRLDGPVHRNVDALENVQARSRKFG